MFRGPFTVLDVKHPNIKIDRGVKVSWVHLNYCKRVPIVPKQEITLMGTRDESYQSEGDKLDEGDNERGNMLDNDNNGLPRDHSPAREQDRLCIGNGVRRSSRYRESRNWF